MSCPEPSAKFSLVAFQAAYMVLEWWLGKTKFVKPNSVLELIGVVLVALWRKFNRVGVTRMSQQIVKLPLGANGSLEIDDSAGTLSLTGSYSQAFADLGISAQASLGVTVSGQTLLKTWADGTSNAVLKAALTEAAAVLALLPA